MTLEEKMAAFDAEARIAVNMILAQFGARQDELIALARERHAEGHELYGDGNLFEWDDERLARERDEELADAVVYETRRRNLAKARCSRA